MDTKLIIELFCFCSTGDWAHKTRRSGQKNHPCFNEITIFLHLRCCFSHPIVFWKSAFSPKNNFSFIFVHKELSFSWSLTCYGFDIQYFIPSLLIASFFKGCLSSTFVKDGHAVVGKETLKYQQVLRKFPKIPYSCQEVSQNPLLCP